MPILTCNRSRARIKGLLWLNEKPVSQLPCEFMITSIQSHFSTKGCSSIVGKKFITESRTFVIAFSEKWGPNQSLVIDVIIIEYVACRLDRLLPSLIRNTMMSYIFLIFVISYFHKTRQVGMAKSSCIGVYELENHGKWWNSVKKWKWFFAIEGIRQESVKLERKPRISWHRSCIEITNK